MLTVEQVKAYSEISVKSEGSGWASPSVRFEGYKAKLSYLKNGKICRLSIVDNFIPPIPIEEKQSNEWGESELRLLIPIKKWEIFTRFVNDSETLNEDMLLSWQEVRAYMESHKGNNLGTYKMLGYGEIKDIDVQANVRGIYDMAVEACKTF